MFEDLEGKYEANEVIVQQLMRTNIEGSLKVHACHLGDGSFRSYGNDLQPVWNQ